MNLAGQGVGLFRHTLSLPLEDLLDLLLAILFTLYLELRRLVAYLLGVGVGVLLGDPQLTSVLGSLGFQLAFLHPQAVGPVPIHSLLLDPLLLQRPVPVALLRVLLPLALFEQRLAVHRLLVSIRGSGCRDLAPA